MWACLAGVIGQASRGLRYRDMNVNHSAGEHAILRELAALKKEIYQMSAAIEALTAAVAALEGAETAAATEFAVLATEIGELKAGSITEAEVSSLAEKAQTVAAALTAATPSGTE